MSYPSSQKIYQVLSKLDLYAQLKHEQGSKSVSGLLAQAEKALQGIEKKMERLPVSKALAQKEPDSLSGIKALRPKGPRIMWKSISGKEYRNRLEGALLARMAGCTLGAIVENWTVKHMEDHARLIGNSFPPQDYWTDISFPEDLRYGQSPCKDYTRSRINGVPVDDDIVYTLLGLLVVEDYGPDFSIEDNGKAWIKYLPHACTAEDIALRNLKKNIPAKRAGASNNPYCEWIGADIRSDPWGYMAPGLPEKAAEMAYRDAYLSHRRNGIYGEMYFSAAIAAAFAVDDPVEALRIGLTEIPKDCRLANDVRWALAQGKKIRDYRDAVKAVDTRFAGMHRIHTNNNACLTIFGVMIGGRNVSKVISQTVAMGYDNDCTAATAGSIAGAVVGKAGIEKHWYKNFKNTVHSYLINRKKFTITGLMDRFEKQAKRVFETVE